MKKFASILSIALAAGLLSSCTEDFKDWANPMSNDPEAPFEVQFTATDTETFDFNEMEGVDTIQIFKPTLHANVEGTTTEYAVELFNEESTKSTPLRTFEDGKALKSEVTSAIIKVCGTQSVLRHLNMAITAYTKVKGQTVRSEYKYVPLNVTIVPVPVPEVWYISGNCMGNGTGSHLASACVAMFPNSENYEELIYACKLDKASTFWIYKKEGSRYPVIGTSKDDGAITSADDAAAKGNLNPFKPELDEGYYKIVFNVKTLTISYEKLDVDGEVFTAMAMPGSWQTTAWSPGADLMTPETTNATLENHDWSATVTFATDCEFKFCANGDWCGKDWGSAAFPLGTCVGGDNINGTAGTYKVYFNDLLKSFYFEAVEE